MDATQCLGILRDTRDCAFATVDENGLPQVRIIDVMIVEDDKLYFCTSRGKDFHKQLMRDGHVAITGLNSAWQSVRAAGRVERLDDQKHWIDRIFEDNPSMNDVYPGNARYILEAFRLDCGQLEFFDLSTQPINREYVPFGGEEPLPHGFRITDECIGCSTCQDVCPQGCIEEGEPFRIQPEHCLHCGLCHESCPADAIIRL